MFVPEDPQRASVPVELAELSPAGTEELKIPYLASTFGGPVAVEPDKNGRLALRRGFHVALFKASDPAPAKVVRGVIHVEGRAESLAVAVWRQLMRVIVRETSV